MHKIPLYRYHHYSHLILKKSEMQRLDHVWSHRQRFWKLKWKAGTLVPESLPWLSLLLVSVILATTLQEEHVVSVLKLRTVTLREAEQLSLESQHCRDSEALKSGISHLRVYILHTGDMIQESACNSSRDTWVISQYP